MLKRNDGFWKIIEVSPKNVGRIMDGIASPVQTLSVSRRGIKRGPELLYSLLGASQPEDAFYIRGCESSATYISRAQLNLTLFFKINTALSDYDGNIAIDIALAVLVKQRYGDVGVGDALDERHTKYALRDFCIAQWWSVSARSRDLRGCCRHGRIRPRLIRSSEHLVRAIDLWGKVKRYLSRHPFSRVAC